MAYLQKINSLIEKSCIEPSLIEDDYRIDDNLILEDSDLYGFSLTKDFGDIGENSSSPSEQDNSSSSVDHAEDLIDIFKRDTNWNNPAAISLMCRTYQITEIKSYQSNLMEVNESAPDYLTIRKLQNKLFACTYVDEGKALLADSQQLDAIHRFSLALRYDNSSVDALHSRATVYKDIGKPSLAARDFKKVLDMDSNNTSAAEFLKDFNNQIIITKDTEGNDSSQVQMSLLEKVKLSLSNDKRSSEESTDTDSSSEVVRDRKRRKKSSNDGKHHKSSKKSKKHKKDKKKRRKKS